MLIFIVGIEVFYDVNYELEDLIQADEENIVPGLGEGGKPVEHLPGVSQHMIDEIMKTEAMNKILSDKISYSRKIPDARHPLYDTFYIFYYIVVINLELYISDALIWLVINCGFKILIYCR